MTIRQPTPVGQLAAGRGQRRLEAADEAVVAVLGQLVAALALDGQLDLAAAPAADLELDAVGQRERDAEAVVAGPEVGRGGRHLDRDGAAVEFGEPVGDHGYQPSATATAPTVGAASMHGPTWRSAVVGSLRPWPVSTHTTSASGSSSPAAAALRTPATPAAEAGSQKIPS